MNILNKAFCRAFQFAFRVAIPFLPYREPECFPHIHDLIQPLKERNISSVLLVTDVFLKNSGATEDLESTLHDAGIRCAVYHEVNSNPTVDNVEAALAMYYANGCQCLVAFGGGSAIDCAKAVGARIAYPKKTLNQMKGNLRVWRKLPPLVAIPTTAGTGSEVTVTAVITDSRTHHKYTMNNFAFIPAYAVHDPAVTYTLPPSVTATTGMDALTHAVEAYIGGSTTKETRALAKETVKLVFDHLETAYHDGSDHAARKHMLRAAYAAGVAFSKSYVGYIHAVAHSLGGQYNIPHGLANSVLMPYVLESYGECVHKKLHELAVVAGVSAESDSHAEGAAKFICAIRQMNERMGIPTTLHGIQKADIPTMAHHAHREANPLYPVPKLMDAEELEQFYYAVMEKKEAMPIDTILQQQRQYFQSGATLPVSFRVAMLKKLLATINKYESEISAALTADLGKSDFEGFMCEIGLVRSEISHMIKHTRRYAKEKTVWTPLAQFASRSYVKPTPYGNVLIMSPWNYPFLLTIDPLADAIAAGNTAVVKPSAYSPATSAVIAKIITECFTPRHVAVVTGGRQENAALLSKKFDLVFFTGSQSVGKEVLRHTAETLTPAVLELGGKSPCIVDSTARIPLAAKRIVFGKFLNCGQTCVAPDYILCHESVKEQLVSALCREIEKQYGPQPLANPDYGKIVNGKHFDRICGLIDPKKTVIGGQRNEETLQIAPTVMTDVMWDDAVMQEEIFGPVLPVLTYKTMDEVFALLADRPKPLALYLFSEDKKTIREVTARCRYGGGCINDVVIHLATSTMGFGGVGESGMGAYHGKRGFDAFSHAKSILDKKTWMDLPMRYQPYNRGLYGKLLHLFLR